MVVRLPRLSVEGHEDRYLPAVSHAGRADGGPVIRATQVGLQLPTPYARPWDMRVIAEPAHGWSARPALARAMRSVTFLVPVALAAAVTLGGAAALPRPATGPG